MIIISGVRVCLRDWLNEDLSDYQYWNQPEHKWQEFDGPYYPRLSKEELSARILDIKERIDKQDFPTPRQRLAIAEIQSNKMIGQVSWYWQSKETNWISIGIGIFNHEYWGKGIGYEALGLWSEHLFSTMPSIPRLDIRTWSGNKGMMKLAEKLGYTKEACFRNARIVKGEYYDSIGYGILRKEWAELFPNGFAQNLLNKI